MGGVELLIMVVIPAVTSALAAYFARRATGKLSKIEQEKASVTIDEVKSLAGKSGIRISDKEARQVTEQINKIISEHLTQHKDASSLPDVDILKNREPNTD